MSVRPLLLPDTASTAGYDQVDPLIQWFLGGSGTSGATATGITDDDRYGLDLQNAGSGGQSFRATSGNNSYQLRVNNSGITMVGGLNVTGTTTFASPVVMQSTLMVTGTATFTGSLNASGAATFATGVVMQSTLTVTGGVVFRSSLVVTGTASFLGMATVGDSLTVSNDVTVGSSLRVTGASTFTGTSTFRSAVTVFSASGNDQVLLLKHNATAGQFSLGASNSADPSLVLKDNGGDDIALFGNSTSTNKFEVYGLALLRNLSVSTDATISGELSVNGNATLGNAASDATLVNGTLTVTSDTDIGGDLLVSGTNVTLTSQVVISGSGSLTMGNGADITLGTGSRIDFTEGGGAGFTRSTWDGYFEINYQGATKRVPYYT